MSETGTGSGAPARRVVGACGAAVLAFALVIAGCTGTDPSQHGAGEKLGRAEGGSQEPGRGDSGSGGDDGMGPSSGGAGLVGDRLPALQLAWLRPPAGGEAAAGDQVRLDARVGEPLVINVWAAWCTPCRDEMPYFQRLHERADGRLTVLGVDYADDAESARAVLKDLHISYPSMVDPDEALKAPFRLGLGIPVTVYVRGDGTVAHVARTPYRSLDQLRSDVETHLGVSV